MPLKKGSSHKTVSSNIKTEMRAGNARVLSTSTASSSSGSEKTHFHQINRKTG